MPIASIHSPSGRPANLLPEQSGRNAGAASQRATASERSPGAETSSLEERRQKAFQTIEQTLAMGYEKLASKRGGAARAFDRFEPLSAEKVAGNILGFIERRLLKDAAEGATEAQLQARLDAGLAGFEKGFAEAQKQLEALASFSPEIQADIDDTRDRVLTGIDVLRQRILEQQLERGASDEPSDDGKAVSRSGEPHAYEYGEARATRFSFELMTAEGDRVTIQADSSAGVSLSGSGEGGSSLSASASRSLSWSVQGDLNADERSAIESLLGGVDRLAEQFFTGDLEGALDSAMALGYDREQVAGFSLSLSQSSIRQVSETYGRAAGAPEQGPALQERLAPLGQFLRGLESALADASRVAERPEPLVLALAERMVSPDQSENRQAQSLRAFMADMLEALTTDSGGADRAQRNAAETGDAPREA
ncbi:DUF5610 domain-containing protein [Marinimicrobium sp. C6131]|uniref:DUF5610 domain-containing protein n=1 Tax=Marinimicrobium sp. C6131 TaxID=3022676 RepID=UPI00223CF5FB|nr:DUF5610 domain-containing protein [Marinimicrobium sp. C6131]UZJ45600.1 DUF5610 domain-containing protein [Marinimicrobium sp. C6131]